MPKSRKKDPQKIINRVFFGIFIIICVIGLIFTILEANGKLSYQDLAELFGLSPKAYDSDGDSVTVYYLDVGQGDSIVIIAGDKAVLIDSGESDQFQTVSSFLDRQGISRLDLVIGTHPHSDHIGSMYEIIDNFDVGEVILPEIPDELVPTSLCYERLLDSIGRNQTGFSWAEPGTVFTLTDSCEFEILSPLSMEQTNLNNYSVVTRLTHGKNIFLFVGDAEAGEEKELMAQYPNLYADVLKVGHHGSNTSTGKKFMLAVSPEAAVISVGAKNSFSHPSDKVLERLSDYGVTCFRTDRNGTVIAESDGESVQFLTEQ